MTSQGLGLRQYTTQAHRTPSHRRQTLHTHLIITRTLVASGDRKRQNRGTIKTECNMQYVVTQQEDDRDIWHFEIQRFKIDSDSDDEKPIELSSDDEIKINDKDEAECHGSDHRQIEQALKRVESIFTTLRLKILYEGMKKRKRARDKLRSGSPSPEP